MIIDLTEPRNRDILTAVTFKQKDALYLLVLIEMIDKYCNNRKAHMIIVEEVVIWII